MARKNKDVIIIAVIITVFFLLWGSDINIPLFSFTPPDVVFGCEDLGARPDRLYASGTKNNEAFQTFRAEGNRLSYIEFFGSGGHSVEVELYDPTKGQINDCTNYPEDRIAEYDIVPSSVYEWKRVDFSDLPLEHGKRYKLRIAPWGFNDEVVLYYTDYDCYSGGYYLYDTGTTSCDIDTSRDWVVRFGMWCEEDCSYFNECSEIDPDNGCGGTCTRNTDGNSCDGGASTCSGGICLSTVTDTSPVTKSPGTAVIDPSVGTEDWTEVTNVMYDDGFYSVAVVTTPLSSPVDNSVKLVKGGIISGDNKATGTPIANGGTYKSYGSSTDLWGLSLTPSDINSGNFGVAYSVRGNLGTSKYIKTENFGFNIPDGATITGIKVDVKSSIGFVQIYLLSIIYHIRITVYFDCACSSGVCCDDGCGYTSGTSCGANSCPSDYYTLSGGDSPTSTNYCYLNDYPAACTSYCSGSSPDCQSCSCSTSQSTQTMGEICQYINGCSGSTPGTVANYDVGTSCGSNVECDGSGNCIPIVETKINMYINNIEYANIDKGLDWSISYTGANPSEGPIKLVGVNSVTITAPNNFITITYDTATQSGLTKKIYLPISSGVLPTLYVADDGSTYYNAALTNLAYHTP